MSVYYIKEERYIFNIFYKKGGQNQMLLDFDNAVNIFTDCSTYRGESDKTLVSCGYCVVVDNEIVEHYCYHLQ